VLILIQDFSFVLILWDLSYNNTPCISWFILHSSSAISAGSSLLTDIVITQILTKEKNTKLDSFQITFLVHSKEKSKLSPKSHSNGNKKKYDYYKKKYYIKSEYCKLKVV